MSFWSRKKKEGAPPVSGEKRPAKSRPLPQDMKRVAPRL